MMTDPKSVSAPNYKQLFQKMAHGVVYHDATGYIISANPAAEAILGLTLDQMQGRTSMDPRWRAIHEDGSDFPGETHPAVVTLRTGKPVYDIIMGVFNPQKNSYRWITINAIPLYEPNASKPYQVFATFTDITHRKMVSEALLEAERRFSTLLQNVPGMAYRCRNDQDWTMEFVSEGCFKLTGYSPVDLVNNKNITFADLIHPNDRETVWDKVQTALATGKPYAIEYRIITADGTLKYLWERGVAVVEQALEEETNANSVIYLEGFMIDITDQKEVEAALRISKNRYQKLFDRATDAIFLIKHRGGIVVDANAAAEKMLGRSAAYLRNFSIYNLVELDSRKRLVELNLGDRLAANLNDIVFIREFGQHPISSISVIAISDELLFVIAQDITKQKQAENTLRNLTQYLQKAREYERTRLAREIHDEVGQSLTALKFDLNWLDKNTPEDAYLLKQRTMTALDLADNLLDTVRRLSSELRPGLLDDLGLTAAVEWQLESFSRRTSIDCDSNLVELDVDLPDEIITNVFRIFQEVLTNVARHAQASELYAELFIQMNQLVLMVRDNGIGIDAGKLDDRQSLGLIGMNERANAIYADLSIVGMDGMGTTVTLTVPLSGVIA